MDTYKFQISEIEGTVEIKPVLHCIGDEEFIDQIFSNLIGNAIKYRQATRLLRIQIDGEWLPDASRYRVKDNGIGIDNIYHEKVWDVFSVQANLPKPPARVWA